MTGDPYEARKAACTTWMMSDYPTGLDESWCTAEFALPSAFLIKCARAKHLGFASAGQKEACRLMFLKAAEDMTNGIVLN